jgi:asparagine synthase (glutamine-hydrolysing)
MRHRGPDGAGLWLSEDRRVGFAHRRLSIVDLSDAASQPMSDARAEIWITYNGEIYNHAQLRRELEALGHRFRTDHSDTEVIIHAYRQWGTDCVHRFRGMFAFGLWDQRSQRLWLVRDRLGIKPIYYSIHRGTLRFASEIKALLTDPEQPRSLDEEAFFHYLSFLTAPAPATLFAGISKLACGSMVIAAPSGAVEVRRYWDPLQAAKPVEGSDEEIAERILAELRNSVRLRRMSDVPVGVFLSGGIDSSTIAALFSEGETRPIKTFSIAYDRDYASYKSELDHAQSVALGIGAEHHELRISSGELVDFLPRMIELQDEPIADPVCVPLYYLARLARERGVVVGLVGEGSDELFWGYPSWKRSLRLQRFADRFRPLSIFGSAGLAGLRLLGKQRTHAYDWLARAVVDHPVFWGGAEAFCATEKQRILSPRLREQFRGRSSWEAISPIHQRFQSLSRHPSPLGWMTYLDLNLRLPELLLMRVDKMTMGASLEARVPFLDHEIVALALGISEQVKTRGGVLKAVLKQAVRGIIPDAIIDRPKQGFGVPVREWLSAELLRDSMPIVKDFIAETDLLDGGVATALFGESRRSELRWPILNAALWWDRFIRRGPEIKVRDPLVPLAAGGS